MLLATRTVTLAVFLLIKMALSPCLVFGIRRRCVLPVKVTKIMTVTVRGTVVGRTGKIFGDCVPAAIVAKGAARLAVSLIRMFLSGLVPAASRAKTLTTRTARHVNQIIPVVINFTLNKLKTACFVLVSRA